MSNQNSLSFKHWVPQAAENELDLKKYVQNIFGKYGVLCIFIMIAGLLQLGHNLLLFEKAVISDPTITYTIRNRDSDYGPNLTYSIPYRMWYEAMHCEMKTKKSCGALDRIYILLLCKGKGSTAGCCYVRVRYYSYYCVPFLTVRSQSVLWRNSVLHFHWKTEVQKGQGTCPRPAAQMGEEFGLNPVRHTRQQR